MIELLLLQKPIYSARDPPSFEIIKADLVPRSSNPVPATSSSHQRTMHFRDWDELGRKGTWTHLVSAWGLVLVEFLDSGIWALVVFLLAVIAFFVVLCVISIFSFDFCRDDYEKAQSGKGMAKVKAKARARVAKGRRSDVETGKMVFRSAEELGLVGRGKVIGLGKSD